MAKELHSAGEVIDALGGSGATASITKKTIQAVSNWRGTNKLPASTYLVLSQELQRRDLSAPLSLWGMQQPEAGAA